MVIPFIVHHTHQNDCVYGFTQCVRLGRELRATGWWDRQTADAPNKIQDFVSAIALPRSPVVADGLCAKPHGGVGAFDADGLNINDNDNDNDNIGVAAARQTVPTNRYGQLSLAVGDLYPAPQHTANGIYFLL